MPSATATEEKRKKRTVEGGQIRESNESPLKEQIELLRLQNEMLKKRLKQHKGLLREHRALIEEQRGVGGAQAGPSSPKPEAEGLKDKGRKRKRIEASPPKSEAKRRKRMEAEASPPKVEAKHRKRNEAEASPAKAKAKHRKLRETEASPAKGDAQRRKEKEAEVSPNVPNDNKAHGARSASIVTAIVFKALYDKAEVGLPVGAHEERAVRIRKLRKSFRRFGFKKPEEVDEFADMVS